MPAPLDVVLVLAIVAWVALDQAVLVPAARRAISAGVPGARLRVFRRIALSEWLLAAAVLARWVLARRSMGALGLVAPAGWRLALGAGVAIAIAALAGLQVRAVALASPARLARSAERLPAGVRFLLPHTPAERTAFLWLSLTAGICEELLFRGFLIWFVAAWTGAWWAALLTSAAFGFGHAYQGASRILTTGIVGFGMAALYLATRSLVPGMLAHALIDAGSGEAAYRLVSAGAGLAGSEVAPAQAP